MILTVCVFCIEEHVFLVVQVYLYRIHVYIYIHRFLSLVFFASLVFLEITSLNLRFAGLLQLWAPELFEDKVQPEMPPLVSANWLWAALSDNPKAALADIVNTKSET